MVGSAASRPVLLIGSVPLGSAEEVLTILGANLSGFARRLPDGETGARVNWVGWQGDKLRDAIGIEEQGRRPTPTGGKTRAQYGLKIGGTAAEVRLGALGYAEFARSSYEIFEQLRRTGKIAPETRLQISLPTPMAVVCNFFLPQAVRPIWPVYQECLFAEIDQILSTVPPEDLAIQWDFCSELTQLILSPDRSGEFSRDELVAGLARAVDRVPAASEVGVHFCYGDMGHRHTVEPEDTGLMVDLANRLLATARRPITWMHMPVPRGRDDDAYFSPLRELHRPPGMEFYLGLVHRTDGIAGAKRRLAAAERAIREFGVATECGLGRRPPETIADLLQLHRDVALATAEARDE